MSSVHPYTINAPVTKLPIDAELLAQFPTLLQSLKWRPLTDTMSACELGSYMYFRIELRLRRGSDTYAGYSNGASIMLQREVEPHRRTFILRHWIHSVPPHNQVDAPLVPLPHFHVAVQNEHLLLKLNLDRPFSPNDTFNSVPFSTWMFQVVECDSIIHGIPGIRFMFSVERTITTEERNQARNSSFNIPTKGARCRTFNHHPTPVANIQNRAAHPQYSQKVHSAPYDRISKPPIHTLPSQGMRLQRNSPVQPAVGRLVNITQSTPYAGQPVTPRHYQPSRARQVQTQTGKTAARVNKVLPVVGKKVQQKNEKDAIRPVIHPVMRLWEYRDLDDPYQPIFISQDAQLEEKTGKQYIVDEEDPNDKFHYNNLTGHLSQSYNQEELFRPRIQDNTGEPDIEVIVPIFQPRKNLNEGEVENGHDEQQKKSMKDEKYAAAVAAAADYNVDLSTDRAVLKKWLEEDVPREEEESQEEDEDGGEEFMSD